MRLIIFTYAPTGLGHLRVTDALVESRPVNTNYVLLGSIDKFLTNIHRFTSINPIGKYIFVKSQYGFWEDFFDGIYRKFFISYSQQIYKQLVDIILRNPGKDEIWIVATHFGMAHQIGALKEKLMKETGRVIRLLVQVTDDTSQHIWCVRGADLTFVPSYFVKKQFEDYARRHKIEFNSEVIPYPLSPALTAEVPKSMGSRSVDFSEQTQKIKVAVPISGAAVGLTFLEDLIKKLGEYSDRFEFFVVVKKSAFTTMFINSIAKLANVKVMVGKNDSEMITLYELLYEKNLIDLEITKPSEQTFKAILTPKAVAGSILLFTAPVGRQEIDNLEFLRRHGLIWEKGVSANSTRALKLSENASEAADEIYNALKDGAFAEMTSPKFRFSEEALASGEIGPDGASKFWERAFLRLNSAE